MSLNKETNFSKFSYFFLLFFCFSVFVGFSIVHLKLKLFSSFFPDPGTSASFNEFMLKIQQKAMHKPRDVIYLDDQTLQLVVGQRGKPLLVLNGYTFATNLVVDQTTYWCCRHRTVNSPPCHARAKTVLKDNGLHSVIISQPVHNHKPTFRVQKKWWEYILIKLRIKLPFF